MSTSATAGANVRRRLLWTVAWAALFTPPAIGGVALWRSAALRDAQLASAAEVCGDMRAICAVEPKNPGWMPDSWLVEPRIDSHDSDAFRADRRDGWTAIFDRLTGVHLFEVKKSNGLSKLADCSSLENLSAEGARIEPQEWLQLAACRQVKDLAFPQSRLQGLDLSLLRGHARLERLDLFRTEVVDEQLAFLQNLPSLQELNLAETPVAGRFLREQGELVALRKLTLDGCAFDDEGIRRAAMSCPRLEELSGRYCRGVGGGAAALGLAPSLTRLDLRDTAVDDAALAGLARSTTLGVILVQQTKITGKGLLLLAKIPTLKQVGINHYAVDAADREAFRRLRPDVRL